MVYICEISFSGFTDGYEGASYARAAHPQSAITHTPFFFSIQTSTNVRYKNTPALNTNQQTQQQY